MSDFDPFKPESGLKGDYVGTIADAYFEATQYGVQLRLKVLDTDDNSETENRYGVGPDWATFDGGQTIQHPSGVTKGFNGATAISELITSAFKSGAESEMRKRSSEQYQSRGPMNAAFWKGFQFYWEVVTETKKMRDRETGEQIERDVSRILPTKYLGVLPQGTVNPQMNQQPPVQTQQPQSQQGPLVGVSEQTVAAIKAAAQSKPYSDFVDEVMTMKDSITGQDLVTNANLISALANENLYNELRGS